MAADDDLSHDPVCRALLEAADWLECELEEHEEHGTEDRYLEVRDMLARVAELVQQRAQQRGLRSGLEGVEPPPFMSDAERRVALAALRDFVAARSAELADARARGTSSLQFETSAHEAAEQITLAAERYGFDHEAKRHGTLEDPTRARAQLLRALLSGSDVDALTRFALRTQGITVKHAGNLVYWLPSKS